MEGRPLFPGLDIGVRFSVSPGVEPEKLHRAEKMDVGCELPREKVAKGRPTSPSGAKTTMLGTFLAVILVQRIDVSIVIRETTSTSSCSRMTLLGTCRMGALVVWGLPVIN